MIEFRSRFLYLGALLIMSAACAPSETVIQTEVAARIAVIRARWTPIPTQTPFPTLTPIPTSTSTPEPTSTPEKAVLLEENFEGPSNCFLRADLPSGRVFVEGERLHIEANETDANLWSSCDERAFSDFVLEAEVSQVEGPDDNFYGLIFRDTGSVFYQFSISGNGF